MKQHVGALDQLILEVAESIVLLFAVYAANLQVPARPDE